MTTLKLLEYALRGAYETWAPFNNIKRKTEEELAEENAIMADATEIGEMIKAIKALEQKKGE